MEVQDASALFKTGQIYTEMGVNLVYQLCFNVESVQFHSSA